MGKWARARASGQVGKGIGKGVTHQRKPEREPELLRRDDGEVVADGPEQAGQQRRLGDDRERELRERLVEQLAHAASAKGRAKYIKRRALMRYPL